MVRLAPQLVPRLYADGNRLGQRLSGARRPKYYRPERWIGSSTLAVNPSPMPSGGLSKCPEVSESGRVSLRRILADRQEGPRLLGPQRYEQHGGEFRVLIKVLDARNPIPVHVHANDIFVAENPAIYPDQRFGKEEAYHFLDLPKGHCPYTHLGFYEGVMPEHLFRAMQQGDDQVLELCPGTLQSIGEGFYADAGLIHRPGTAVTLEIQQPSDVYTFFASQFDGMTMDAATIRPGFNSIQEAAASVIDWEANQSPDLLNASHLHPVIEPAYSQAGARVEWIYPPDLTDKFSGMRLTIDTRMTFKAMEPGVLFVWRGQGRLDGRPVDGGGGIPGEADEFFIGFEAASRGIELENTGDELLVAFVLFAAVA